MKVIAISLFAALAGAVGLFLAGPFSGAPLQDGAIHLTADEAAKLIEDAPGLVVLDVRTSKEYQSGHIKGAVNVDYWAKDFQTRLAGLDRERAYLVHCQTGRRSGHAVPVMRDLGFEKIYHLDGGVRAWANAGYKLVSD